MRLPAALREWVAENVLRGLPRESIAARLAEQGLDPIVARSEVDTIADSPELRAARKMSRRLRQLEMMDRLRRALAETHSAPDGIARRPRLDAESFFEDHYVPNQPVVIPGLAADWPARRWTPELLAERYGDVVVRITDGRDDDPDYDMHSAEHTREVKLSAYVDRITRSGPSNDCYLVANNRNLEDAALAGLMDDVRLDDAMFKVDRWKGCSALWLGPAGTITPLHHDTCNILFVQLYGRKHFRLIAPYETTLLDGARSMYGAPDPMTDDMGAVRVREVVLEPGDAIFLPIGWWHHVVALDVSVSLAFTHFARSNAFTWYRPGDVV